MKIKLKYEKQSDLPEAFADLYEEKDGAWVLTGIEGLQVDSVTRLEGALKKERDARKKAEDQLKKFAKLGDRDVEDIIEALDEVDELKAKLEHKGEGKDEEAIQKRIETAVASQTRKIERERDEWKKKAETAEGSVSELSGTIKAGKIEAALTSVATEAKVTATAIPDIHLGYARLFEVDDDGKTVRTKDNVGVTPGLTPAEWLGEMREKRPQWWASSEGGGARGGNGKLPNGTNPFDKKNPNLSKAGQLMTTDPAKADNMARAAGYANAKAAIDGMGKAAASLPRGA